MKRTFGFAVIFLGMFLCASASANAMIFGHKVPEIDPGMAIGGLAFLAGSLALLRVRRKK